jgi:hypothetical protein
MNLDIQTKDSTYNRKSTTNITKEYHVHDSAARDNAILDVRSNETECSKG